MKENGIIIKHIDKIRQERKMNIKDLTIGIISQRSYSRYVSESHDLPLNIITKFLDRLNIPVYELAARIYNEIFHSHINEIWFFEYVRQGDYQKAFNEFYPLIKNKTWGSSLASKTIPAAIVYMEYKLNHITKIDAQVRLSKIVDVNAIITNNLLLEDEIQALNIYVLLCNDQDKTKISNFLVPKIVSNQLMIVTQTMEVSTHVVHLTTLQTLTSKEVTSQLDHENIQKVLPYILEYQKRAKPAIFDIKLFEILYKYSKKQGLKNKVVVFHYLSSILSTWSGFNLNDKHVVIDQADVDAFLECLNDSAFLSKPMYEELITHGIC